MCIISLFVSADVYWRTANENVKRLLLVSSCEFDFRFGCPSLHVNFTTGKGQSKALPDQRGRSLFVNYENSLKLFKLQELYHMGRIEFFKSHDRLRKKSLSQSQKFYIHYVSLSNLNILQKLDKWGEENNRTFT